MNPLARGKVKLKKPFGVFDIESANWKDFLAVGATDGLEYHAFHPGGRSGSGMEDFLHWAFDSGVNEWWAHFGGIFDFLFVLQAVFESEDFESHDFVPRGSGILTFKVSRGDQVLSFKDSGALLPFALKSLTKSFGVAHQKLDENAALFKKVTPKMLKYLRHDVLGLHEVLQSYFSRPLIQEAGPKTTMASQALQVFRTRIKEPIPACPRRVDAEIRKAYAGGRTEIFKPVFDGPGKIRIFDVNSIYPHVMRENNFPGQYLGHREQIDFTKIGFARAKVYVPEDDDFPVLWRKPEGEKFTFPVGVFDGLWPIPELKYALERGAWLLEDHGFYEFDDAGPIFEEFISDLYAIRMAATNEVDSIIAKLIMNALYGRMGLDLEKETLELDHGQAGVKNAFEIETAQGIVRFVRGTTELKSFSNVAIGAYVTAFARIHIHELLEPIHKHVWYMDTDSAFTTKDLGDSKELGAFKLERHKDGRPIEEPQAAFVLPKTYIAGSKIAMKGFDKKKAAKFTYEDFIAQLEGEMRLKENTEAKLSRFKSALKSGSFLSLSKPTSRQIRSRYDKRDLFKSPDGKWASRPLTVWEI